MVSRTHSFEDFDPKHPLETRLLAFEWFPLLASFWKPGQIYAVADVVQPTQPTGFAYQRASGTQSGKIEPAWGGPLAATFNDGDGTWTAIAATGGGVQPAASPIVTEATGEITVSSVQVVTGKGASSKVQCLMAGGKSGKRYRMKCQINVGSQVWVGTAELPVSVDV